MATILGELHARSEDGVPVFPEPWVASNVETPSETS